MTREEAEKEIRDAFTEVWADGIIKALKQEPKKGHWILTDDNFVYCSQCEDSYYPKPIDASWYFCPHCGAKMEEVEE